MEKPIHKTLYHYCSLPTFQKIIENRSIWLSDVSKSNDSLEMKWLYERFNSFVSTKEISCLKYQKGLYRSLKKEIKATGKTEKVQTIPDYDSTQIENLHKQLKTIKDFGVFRSYVFCLSEVKDSLSQWRGYADDGRGISIGFNGNYFDLFNIFKETEIADIFAFKKIIYGDMNAKQFFGTLPEMHSVTQESSSEELIKSALNSTLKISRQAAFFKNGSFSGEKEWRIALTLDDYKYDKSFFDVGILSELFVDKYYFSSFRFRTTNSRIIPYINLELLQIKDALSDIYIGPKCDVSKRDMKMFLIANGLLTGISDNSIRIHYSASSYK